MATRGPRLVVAVVAVVGAAATLPIAGAGAHPAQHGEPDGHLIGTGAWGDLEHVGTARVTSTDDIVADVAVDPHMHYAYLAHWGKPDCDANSEAGGKMDPDAGAFVMDISDPANPRQVGFIPHSQDSRPGEGMQVLHVTTRFYDGHMLVMNNEQCGKNGRGGVSLYDVSNPLKPSKLSEHFGDRGFADTNDIHSAFAWDAGDKAYVVIVDNEEATDVDILDVTNPKRPVKITDLNVNALSASLGDPVFQPELALEESFLHDMVVKEVDGHWILLLSYWDGGYVQLNVDDPANPVFIRDTDYQAKDPELVESGITTADGRTLPPEGNGHQAEFTADDRFFIATDEDFSPYRPDLVIDGLGPRPAGEFGWAKPIVSLPDKRLSGPTVYGGYGCPSVRDEVPAATDPRQILVLQRGPVGDSSANYSACYFSEKVETAELKGYAGAVVANHHAGGGGTDAYICGSKGHDYDPQIPAICIGHITLHEMFGKPVSFDYSAGQEPVVGQSGAAINATAEYDGWGYVHLYDREKSGTAAGLDTFAIPEAHDPAYAFGYGDLTVHEVATDPVDAQKAYLSYYSAGMRSLKIECHSDGECHLHETGGFLDADGNDFWGVEAYRRNGKTYIAGSDRDSGLYIFQRK